MGGCRRLVPPLIFKGTVEWGAVEAVALAAVAQAACTLCGSAYKQSVLTVSVTLLCSLKSVQSLQFSPTVSHKRYQI